MLLQQKKLEKYEGVIWKLFCFFVTVTLFYSSLLNSERLGVLSEIGLNWNRLPKIAFLVTELIECKSKFQNFTVQVLSIGAKTLPINRILVSSRTWRSLLKVFFGGYFWNWTSRSKTLQLSLKKNFNCQIHFFIFLFPGNYLRNDKQILGHLFFKNNLKLPIYIFCYFWNVGLQYVIQ